MPTRNDVFPSKYLKAADLNGKPITVVIATATLETLKSPEGKEQLKTILTFKGTKKALPLNMTNFDACAEITGEDDTDNWPGHSLELYPSTTELKGKTKDCIRIRPPAQRELPTRRPVAAKPAQATVAEEMDDEIPF
jgi:hypothetical protein